MAMVDAESRVLLEMFSGLTLVCGSEKIASDVTEKLEEQEEDLAIACGLLKRGESSGLTPERSHEKSPQQLKCAICMEPIAENATVALACGDYYDRRCLEELVEHSMVDASLMPPRCCRQEIPDHHIKAVLDADRYIAFGRKKIEFSCENPTYCPVITCSAFLLPETDITGDVGTCSECQTHVCVHCKNPAHGAEECEHDPAIQAVRELERQMGWKKCYNCRRTIELTLGW
ncbi:hypothetical protein HDU85_004117 [Gaertneriomyces sp. JEL0708]|nr:hypothetical protein HDU85_004117 [Gaertneriomyces sp. JEL0708]